MNESQSKLPSPEVSVIIPAYNLEGYLDTCLQSVLAQTLGNFEAIVVDDGSTDGTPGLLRRYAERDPRIIVVSTPNRGVARARETGIARAQGKYIAFLDGDDFWEPRMLEEMTASIGQNGGYDIVCCNFKRVCKTYQAIYRESRTEDMEGLEFLEATLRHSIWVTLWGKLYRRELFNNGLNHFEYCCLFCSIVERELQRHGESLRGHAEFYALLNKVRWYSVYVCKSRSPWVGNQAFVCDLRESAGRYRDELRAYYSRARMLLLELDRYRAMRPVVVMLTTGLRWRTSLRRRLAR